MIHNTQKSNKKTIAKKELWFYSKQFSLMKQSLVLKVKLQVDKTKFKNVYKLQESCDCIVYNSDYSFIS